MKKHPLFPVLFAVLFVCPAFAQETKAPSEKEISQGMAEVWCDKMLECSQDKSIGVKECRQTMYEGFKKGFDALPKDKKIELSRPTYEECRQNIKKSGCEELKKAPTLPACEFIGLLGG